jgi:hypothetical protein
MEKELPTSKPKSQKEREMEFAVTPMNIQAGILKNRPTINHKVKWNGKQGSFAPFRRLYEAWLYQTGQHYILNPFFRKSYIEGGWEKAAWYCNGNSRNQVDSDAKVQFGALLQCCNDPNGAGEKYLIKQ